MSIVVTHLTKQYGEQKAVNDISFAAGKGEIVGFLGPNGAGKSTTLKMITGYLPPDAGTVTICGMDIRTEPLAIKQKIGYLPEANPLYVDMYVREYLDFIAGVHRLPNKKEQIERVIALTGLTLESRKKISQLSKGYRQRTGLAAALIHDPEVLILDEPTSGLDPNQIIEIRNVIREQGKTKTVLFSSHILQEVQAICTRVIIINKGNIVANDTVRNLQQSKQDEHIVKVAFREPVAASLLSQLQGVEHVEEESSGGYKLRTADPESVRRQLLDLSVNHRLNIISLQSEEHSLEEVFRSLTAGNLPA